MTKETREVLREEKFRTEAICHNLDPAYPSRILFVLSNGGKYPIMMLLSVHVFSHACRSSAPYVCHLSSVKENVHSHKFAYDIVISKQHSHTLTLTQGISIYPFL